MIEGSCLCGRVAYRCGDLTTPIGHCHCHTCQKAHSAAFATTARTRRDGFGWTKGSDIVAHYESSPGKLRHFCPRCGSQLLAEWTDQDELILRIGCVDSDLGQKAAAHIWMSHAAPWCETKDDLPKFAEGAGSAPFVEKPKA